MISVDYSSWEIPKNILSLMPFDLVIKYRGMPFSLAKNALNLVVDESFDAEKKEILEFILGRTITPMVVDKSLIEKAIGHFYQPVNEDSLPTVWESSTTAKPDVSSEREVLGIINEGIQRGASDIHWETQSHGKELVVRYRVDGVLVNCTMGMGRKPTAKVISHIKLLSNMSIDQKRLPQDGRLPWSYCGKKYDVRVSSLPTINGESLVMRILDREDMNLDVKMLGLLEEDMLKFKILLEKRDGLILATGPTGSGKTTTLYASLNFRNQLGDKIITVEDPVEYEFGNFSQISVSPSVGVTFASALRAMLRQSPNTIMVGEIRDNETTQIAINAALTGHLVLSTLHTNDTLSAVLRLLDLGAEPYQIAAALRGVVAQRLVRQLCSYCKQPYVPRIEELNLLGINYDNGRRHTFFHPKGCELCQNTGFKGRLGLFEILPMDKLLSRLIYDGSNFEDLQNYVQCLRITSLRECGIKKIFNGLTTIEEVVASII